MSTPEDEYLWLEEIDSPTATAWVDEHTSQALATLTSDRFERLREEIRDVLHDDRRIVYPTVRAEYAYELWRDAAHPRGLWRRTRKEKYADPHWDVLLDVDALGAVEGESWVLSTIAGLSPYNRFLIGLSRGGADAEVFREFDVAMRRFVDDGFFLPEAKSDVRWVDHDTILVATDFGPGSMSASGYPRIAKLWRRGTALEEAETIYEVGPDDMLVSFTGDRTPGFEKTFITRWTDFLNREWHLLKPDGSLELVPLPTDAWRSAHAEWMVICLQSAWRDYPSGTLLVTSFDALMSGAQEWTVLFTPTENTALRGYAWTRHHLIVDLMTDVQNHSMVFTHGDTGWSSTPMTAPGPGITTSMVDTNPTEDDEYFVASQGYLQPPTLLQGSIGGSGAASEKAVKQGPAYFAIDGMETRQLFATSADGTRIPYFVTGSFDGPVRPALLRAYGGFGRSMIPEYSGSIGRFWLARGGLYVVANIRGGGEYGPQWREAAMRDKRPRAYEDLAAVAEDLVERGLTTKDQLGAWGGSNGGLLMGVMLTRYPDLFGALVIRAPLLDMLRYHKLLAGASWIAEYGDPDVPSDRAFIEAYSPYQNVRAGMAYPPILFTGSTRDDRVHPGHARKMAARLLDLGYDVTFYENREGGHVGAADHEQEAFVSALLAEFLWRRIGRR